MKISTILDSIDLGAIALPEFQRGYVWNREQVRRLMHSLYRKHPVGGLLVWVTTAGGSKVRHDQHLAPGSVKLLLDGQQRITSLYGIIRGKPPQFFDGDAAAFTGIHFNLETESFEFYSPLKMKDDPLWIDVTELMRQGVGEFIARMLGIPTLASKLPVYLNRLNQISAIKEINLHIEEVTGADKSVDVVVDIFNSVNSGGTKLSKGDLALARVCAGWPDARSEMQARLRHWTRSGFDFRLELLLRCITTILTGEAMFSALADVETENFRDGLKRAETAIDKLLNMIGSRLGLDHDRVLGSRYSFPLMARYLELRSGKITDPKERDKLLYWYVHTFMWGRYSGSTESILNRDLAHLETAEGALDRLIAELRHHRGDLRLTSQDFTGWSMASRFYPVLYMLTRVWHARDWKNGDELSSYLLGRYARLHLHHIFPKDKLYKVGYSRQDVNALANFTFLTEETNIYVSNRDPSDYFAEFVQKDASAVASHWIPMEPKLWQIDRYHEFLAERRKLLAGAANDFLDGLLAGRMPERALHAAPGAITGIPEDKVLTDCNTWVVEQGLPAGQLAYELLNPESLQVEAVLDLAWPEGLQSRLSQPVALLIDEGKDVEEAANRAGFRFFTNVREFRTYVNNEILAVPVAA